LGSVVPCAIGISGVEKIDRGEWGASGEGEGFGGDHEVLTEKGVIFMDDLAGEMLFKVGGGLRVGHFWG